MLSWFVYAIVGIGMGFAVEGLNRLVARRNSRRTSHSGNPSRTGVAIDTTRGYDIDIEAIKTAARQSVTARR